MLRARSGWLHSLIIAADHLVSGATCVLVLAMPGMVLPGEDPLPLRLVAVAMVATFLWPLLFEHLGMYQSQRRKSIRHILGRVGLAALVSGAAVGFLSFALSAPLDPRFALVCAGAQLATLGAFRLGIFSALRFARRRGRNYRGVVIIGSGPRAYEAWREIERHREWGLQVLGFADERDSAVDPALDGQKIFKLTDLPDLFREQTVDELLVACPRSMLPSLNPAIQLAASVGVPVTLVSDLFGDFLPPPKTARFGDLPALSFAMVHHNQTMLFLKRLMDVVIAGTLLVLAAPVLAVAGLLIRATSPGPVLFRQIRCGLYGRRFDVLKLRTMYEDAESRRDDYAHLNEMSGPVFKIRNDPRITPVGRYLRRWSLDELPQLWNVLRGDMSLVGPRPPIPLEVAQYETSQRRRLSMRPGLTCLWQVSGRNQIGFEDWVKLDLQYIDTWSVAQDLRILARTVPTVFRGTGS
jgi:exopolysaccharide biosynthesis polyprenyl glycosylphosphotransferase